MSKPRIFCEIICVKRDLGYFDTDVMLHSFLQGKKFYIFDFTSVCMIGKIWQFSRGQISGGYFPQGELSYGEIFIGGNFLGSNFLGAIFLISISVNHEIQYPRRKVRKYYFLATKPYNNLAENFHISAL